MVQVAFYKQGHQCEYRGLQTGLGVIQLGVIAASDGGRRRRGWCAKTGAQTNEIPTYRLVVCWVVPACKSSDNDDDDDREKSAKKNKWAHAAREGHTNSP